MGMKKEKKLAHRAENGYYCLRDGHLWMRKTNIVWIDDKPVQVDTDEFVCGRCPATKTEKKEEK